MRSAGVEVVRQIHKTIGHFFPELFERAEKFADPRKRKKYLISELFTAAIAMFIFKEGSRNEMNLDRRDKQFTKNYKRIFGLRLPQMDAVEDLFRLLKEEELEKLKAELLSSLIENRVLDKYRLFGHFQIAIDGTGTGSFKKNYSGECLHRTRGDTTTYFDYVLEAKLVTSNGFCLSLATEWVSNSGQEYDKQDCELKAFVRLAAKIKKFFPRLPICICADGLYPNKTFFDTISEYKWHYIVTFKDGNLRSLWEEINLLPTGAFSSCLHEMICQTNRIQQKITWINGLLYGNHFVNWIQCEETVTHTKTGESATTKFVQLTNWNIEKTTAKQISDSGRLRWKIENEGFNIQKNHQYNLEHKYSRVSFLAVKNYYQCLQIAHLINQLVEHSTEIVKLKDDLKFTGKYLWERLMGVLRERNLETELPELTQKRRRCQIRLV